MNLEAARRDEEYQDSTVKKCESEADGRGWSVTFDDGWSLWVRDDSGKMGAPPLGACLRKFGRGIGYPVRGIGRVIGGELVGLYRYQTKDEEEAARVGKEAFAARVKALPEVLREALSDAAWAALGASVHTPLKDPDPKNEVGSGYGKAYNHGAYQAALAVHRHVTAVLASTEPKGEP